MCWKTPRLFTAAAQRGQWKVVGDFAVAADPSEVPRLSRSMVFHISEDLKEQFNVFGQDLPEEVEELWERLTEASYRWHENGMFKIDSTLEADNAQLKALGYLDDEIATN
jgi:hypothetical protein